ncbi:MAG: sulfite oxidase-like oxidoreductase [Anaerolineales bacterium]|nr:sulfite oxidase-like oxidoreductase [Anaerolineae bacterium]PWB56873.1 MAG: sulfite oxidase-like oxidoreductase [Anaerolineales bacterium]
MSEKFLSRGFLGKHRLGGTPDRVPPGQYVTSDFPILSAGPTPRTRLDQWSFEINGLVNMPVRWSWDEFIKLPSQQYTVDIHCVTKWTKLDTLWEGVSVDTLIAAVDIDPQAQYVLAFCDGGYSTNMPLLELTGGKAFIAYRYQDAPLPAEHGGPARLVVPALYFWKSAKWVRGLTFFEKDQPGFWETLGYNNHGDPWKEERYYGDRTD